MHYQLNKDVRYPVVAVSAFGSSNSGIVSVPKSVFASGFSADVLAKSFKIDSNTVGKLRRAALQA